MVYPSALDVRRIASRCRAVFIYCILFRPLSSVFFPFFLPSSLFLPVRRTATLSLFLSPRAPPVYDCQCMVLVTPSTGAYIRLSVKSPSTWPAPRFRPIFPPFPPFLDHPRLVAYLFSSYILSPSLRQRRRYRHLLRPSSLPFSCTLVLQRCPHH